MLEKILQQNTFRNRIFSSLCLLLACESGSSIKPDATTHYKDAYIETTTRVAPSSPCPEGQSQYFEDADEDGYGGSNGWWFCDELPGHVTNALDCDDTNDFINPESDEICDNVDNDCNGITDELVFKECSTKCGSGIQLCDKGSWKDCNAGTFCPTGEYTCPQIMLYQTECTTNDCKTELVNKGTKVTAGQALDLSQCLTQNNCTSWYSSCAKVNCIKEYTSCFEGKKTCGEVWKCGTEYAMGPQKEISEIEKICSKELTDCIFKDKKNDMYCTFNVFAKCKEKYKPLIEEKEKKKDTPGDFFGLCATQVEPKSLLLLYDALTCVYDTCGNLPTPNCVWKSAFTCKLAGGIEGCN